jgi:hypothetical protein
MYYCKQGTWVWTDGTILDYTNWYPGEPDGGTVKNCMFMYSNLPNWTDASCTLFTDSKLNYVCKL